MRQKTDKRFAIFLFGTRRAQWVQRFRIGLSRTVRLAHTFSRPKKPPQINYLTGSLLTACALGGLCAAQRRRRPTQTQATQRWQCGRIPVLARLAISQWSSQAIGNMAGHGSCRRGASTTNAQNAPKRSARTPLIFGRTHEKTTRAICCG
jgi:hypothetical protein